MCRASAQGSWSDFLTWAPTKITEEKLWACRSVPASGEARKNTLWARAKGAWALAAAKMEAMAAHWINIDQSGSGLVRTSPMVIRVVVGPQTEEGLRISALGGNSVTDIEAMSCRVRRRPEAGDGRRCWGYGGWSWTDGARCFARSRESGWEASGCLGLGPRLVRCTGRLCTGRTVYGFWIN